MTTGAAMLAGMPGVTAALDPAASAVRSPRQRRRVLRVAHLTDVHVQPERGAAEGLAACLRHVQSRSDKPDVIFTGGDHVMDSLSKDRARTELQWDVWRRGLKADCSLPVY